MRKVFAFYPGFEHYCTVAMEHQREPRGGLLANLEQPSGSRLVLEPACLEHSTVREVDAEHRPLVFRGANRRQALPAPGAQAELLERGNDLGVERFVHRTASFVVRSPASACNRSSALLR